MPSSLRFVVSDLLGRPGARRDESAVAHLGLRVGSAQVDAPVRVAVRLEAMAHGGLLARGDAETSARLSCNRCLTEWEEPVTVEFIHHSTDEADDAEGFQIAEGAIDLGQLVHDDFALALPAAPLCRPDCAGLCPTCGSDLNSDPCEGHGEESDSPFFALRELFDP